MRTVNINIALMLQCCSRKPEQPDKRDTPRLSTMLLHRCMNSGSHKTALAGVYGCNISVIAHHTACINMLVCTILILQHCVGAHHASDEHAQPECRQAGTCTEFAHHNCCSVLGNIAGSMLLGVVVDKTCSYNAAYVIMGIVLIAGGVLALAVADRPAGAAHEREALNGGVQSGAIIARRTDIEMSWQEDDADGADSMHKSGPGLPATDLDSVHDEM